MPGAGHYERIAERADTRAGHYGRKLHTTAGEVNLKVAKLRQPAIREPDHRALPPPREQYGGGAHGMYLAGVSVLWGARASPSTVSQLNKKVYSRIGEWRNKPIEGWHPYVYLDGIVLKRTWGGEVKNVSVLVAVGVNGEGFRQILGVMEGPKEDKSGWERFLGHLKERGLKGVRLGYQRQVHGPGRGLGRAPAGRHLFYRHPLP